MGALLGLLNLILMIAETKRNRVALKVSIQEISYIIELSLMIGLLLLTAGCFIGGIWANESWGRYWGWDPKETWALIVWLNYAAWLHVRLVKGWRGAVLAWWAVIGLFVTSFAFIGVNMFLTGLHSYGTL